MPDDLVTIETPEHIELRYELAGLGSRALAGLVDTLLQGLLTLLVVAALTWLGTVLGLKDTLGFTGAIIVASTGFLAATAYFVLSESLTGGQSPGKRMAGLRVISADGRAETFLQSVLRNIIRAVDMLPFFYTVGLVAVFTTQRSQRLGDLVAGTVVVKERMAELPAQEAEVPLEERQPLSPEAEARLQGSLHLLSPPDFEAAERIVERRLELTPEVRLRLVGQIAESILVKLPSVPRSDFRNAEEFLEALVRLHRQRPL